MIGKWALFIFPGAASCLSDSEFLPVRKKCHGLACRHHKVAVKMTWPVSARDGGNALFRRKHIVSPLCPNKELDNVSHFDQSILERCPQGSIGNPV